MKKEPATNLLNLIVDNFNLGLSSWEDSTGMRANFGFRYNPETGRKEMYVIDMGAAQTAPELSAIERIGKIMADAPTQVVDARQ